MGGLTTNEIAAFVILALLLALLYQSAETLTHPRPRRRLKKCAYPVERSHIFAIDVLLGRTQHESGSVRFGIRSLSIDS